MVFAGMGVPHDTAEQFRRAMESSGALGHTVLFLNLADEPGMQRLLTPRYALTAAEYLAFVVPGRSDELVDELRRFVEHRHVVGGVLLVTLVFFSALAFTVLDRHRKPPEFPMSVSRM